jgi:hypothetical protein
MTDRLREGAPVGKRKGSAFKDSGEAFGARGRIDTHVNGTDWRVAERLEKRWQCTAQAAARKAASREN